MPLPEPLSAHHRSDEFDCGVPSLDNWLKRRARANQISGATRTFVVAENERVIGYYALASGSITVVRAIGRFRRNMPDPIPVAIIARLAVDRAFQGQHIGRSLLRDAIFRIAEAAELIGIRGVVVHAASPEAKAFYEMFGWEQSPADPMTLMITLADVRAILG